MQWGANDSQLKARTSELGKRLLWRAAPRLFNRAVQPFSGQRFSIGVYAGNSLFDLRRPGDIRNPVLTCDDVTDVPAAFVADPFMIRHDGAWQMLFEIMNRTTKRGQIGAAISTDDALTWRYQGTVLRERFHLAYPYVFRHADEVYLVPDSPGHGIRLYRALEFPERWEFVKQVVSENFYSDASIVHYNNRWWMFSAWAANSSDAKSLRLFHANDLLGRWHEHPSSPIIDKNDWIARPAGRVQVVDGRVVRLAQDCRTTYGQSVRAFEIVDLTTRTYAERPLSDRPILERGCGSWNGDGMHHADIHHLTDGGWIACVDGWQAIPATIFSRD